MPKLWNETIDTHRQAVRDATLDATATLVSEHGLASVTMSDIAKQTGIGRATLYKYFPDVQAILAAWHERLIAHHMDQLHRTHHAANNPLASLETAFETYARSIQAQHGHALAALLHSLPHAKHAEQHLQQFIKQLIVDAATSCKIRSDVSPDELAAYALGALSTAGALRTKQAVARLVKLTLSGLAAPSK